MKGAPAIVVTTVGLYSAAASAQLGGFGTLTMTGISAVAPVFAAVGFAKELELMPSAINENPTQGRNIAAYGTAAGLTASMVDGIYATSITTGGLAGAALLGTGTLAVYGAVSMVGKEPSPEDLPSFIRNHKVPTATLSAGSIGLGAFYGLMGPGNPASVSTFLNQGFGANLLAQSVDTIATAGFIGAASSAVAGIALEYNGNPIGMNGTTVATTGVAISTGIPAIVASFGAGSLSIALGYTAAGVATAIATPLVITAGLTFAAYGACKMVGAAHGNP